MAYDDGKARLDNKPQPFRAMEWSILNDFQLSVTFRSSFHSSDHAASHSSSFSRWLPDTASDQYISKEE